MPDVAPNDPINAPLTAADLAECRWEALLPEDLQLDLAERLGAAARDANIAGHIRQAVGLRLLADACSLMLDGDNTAQPLRPWWIGADGRSTPTLESFGPNDIALFAAIAADIPHPGLRARLADIVWSRQPRGNLKFADIAIEAYLCSPLDTQGWNLGGRDAWQRAIHLALLLRRVELATTIEQRLVEAFWREDRLDGAPVGWYASLMFRHLMATDQHPKIAERLIDFAGQLSSHGRFREARDLLSVAVDWLARKGPGERYAEVQAAVAQAWHDEARAALAAPTPSAIAAGDFLEKAIQVYRSVARRYRAALDIDERIEALQRERLDAGERSLAELGMVPIGPADVSEIARESVAKVVGKEEIVALHGLATLWSGPQVEKAEETARALTHGTLFGRLLSRGTTMGADGRVISKIGGRTQDEIEARALQVQMLEHFRINLRVLVQGAILPALDHIAVEHPLNLDTFVTLARNSRLVPPDHMRRLGRALYFGYTRDFETALQYLAPEVESVVRYHLKHAGAVTINTAQDGVQMELGLSTLVRMPQMEAVFGKDLTFEFQAVFCDQDGANLRNDVAHGLITDDIGSTAESVYAWWMVFRLVFLSSPYATVAAKRS